MRCRACPRAMRVLVCICVLLCLRAAWADWNWGLRFEKIICQPAECWEEGSCYCTNRFDGWDSGGIPGDPFCKRVVPVDTFPFLETQHCQCKDCGEGDRKCREFRCDDNVGVIKDDKCYEPNAWGTSLNWVGPKPVNNCYKTKKNCDEESRAQCPAGQYLKGCMRVSRGSCQRCPDLAAGSYWAYPGDVRCTQKPCTPAPAGFFFVSACTSTKDAAVLPCAKHEGNHEGAVRPSASKAEAMYYCPGGDRVLPVPPNAHVSDDYTTFVCNDGYFAGGTQCYPCPRGSACLHGKAYQCPTNFFSDVTAGTRCKLCRSSCSSGVPLRCMQGSIQDAHCVSCNACGEWPETGFNCVIDYEINRLAAVASTCTPCNTASGVAVCSEWGCSAPASM